MAVKLQSKLVKSTRLKLLEQQGYTCAICKQPCTEDQAVLDHNHELGFIRAVLHRGCNAFEGKILKMGKRMGIKDVPSFLLGMMEYHTLHSTDQTGLIHPLHFTPEEKLDRRKAKAKRVRAKLKAAKA